MLKAVVVPTGRTARAAALLAAAIFAPAGCVREGVSPTPRRPDNVVDQTGPRPSTGARAHPYLFFTREDVPALRERLKREPFRRRWKWFKAAADGYLETAPEEIRGVRWQLGVCGTTAFAYVLTGDRRYAERAKRQAFRLARRRSWSSRSSRRYTIGADLVVSETCTALALVYDWCYDALTEDERAVLRDALLEKGISEYLKSVEHDDWWVNSPVSNWRGVVHGGCGLAALAIMDESAEARRAAVSAWENVREHFTHQLFLADGGGHEGVGYNNYTAVFGHTFAVAADRLLGGGEEMYRALTDRLVGYWLVYMKGPDETYANFNNMGEHWGQGVIEERDEAGPPAVLCALYESKVPGGDRLLLWGADNGGARFYYPKTDPLWFVVRRDAPPSGPKPELEPAVLFRGAGHALLRSRRLWLAYGGGWTSHLSHHNCDLGSFVLVADGERMVHDPGYGKGATADHSSILVDGKGQPANVAGRFLRFGSGPVGRDLRSSGRRGPGFHYFASDLSNCYPGSALTRFVRHVVMLPDRFVVILDDLVAARPAAFEWRLQTRHAVEVAGDARAAVIHGRRVRLSVVAAAPEDVEVSRGARSISFVRLRPKEKTDAVALVTVLYPGERPDVSWNADGTLRVGTDTIRFAREDGRWILAGVNGESAKGIPDGTARTLVPFRPGPHPEALPESVDTRFASVRRDHGALRVAKYVGVADPEREIARRGKPGPEPEAVDVVYAPEAVKVDGDLAEWRGVASMPRPYQGAETSSLRFSWREEGLYGAALVKDAHVVADAWQPWGADSVELFIEKDYARALDRDENPNASQYVFSPNPSPNPTAASEASSAELLLGLARHVYGARGGREDAGIVCAWKRTADGYALEFHLPAEALQPAVMAHGTKMGLHFALNDDGRAVEQFYTDKDARRGYRSPAAWGAIRLVRGP